MTIFLHCILWLLWSVLVMATAEYFAHKYTMHRRFFKWKWLHWVAENHIIAHHAHKRTDINIDMPVWVHFSFGAPLLILLIWLAPIGAVMLSLVFLYHSWFWTKIHRAIHDVEDNWLKHMFFYDYFADHHLAHHERPNRNYSVVFPFMDNVFGTKINIIKH